MDQLPATAFFLAVISPLAVAALKQSRWSQARTDLAAAAVVCVCYLLGQAFDGQLTWPLQRAFWIGLLAAFGAQQAAYKFALSPRLMQRLEAWGNTGTFTQRGAGGGAGGDTRPLGKGEQHEW